MIDISNRVYTLKTTDVTVYSTWKTKLKLKIASFGNDDLSDEGLTSSLEYKTPSKPGKGRLSTTPQTTPTTIDKEGRAFGDRTVLDAAAMEHMNLSRQIESIFETDTWYETKQSLKEYLAVKNSMSDASLLLRRCERPCDMLKSDFPQIDPRIDPRVFSQVEALIQEILDRAQKESSDARLVEKLRSFAKFYENELERMREYGYLAARVPPTTLTIVARNSKRCIVSSRALALMDNGTLQTTGHNPVRYISGMYWKEGPELPGIEFAVDLLYKRVMMRGSPPSVLVKRVQCDQLTLEPHTKLYQTSLGVEGHSLNDMDEKDPNWVSSMKRSNFCFMYIMALLTLPQDGKGDNIIVTKVGDKYQLTSIDNDHSFADPICAYRDSKKNSKHCINVRSILFCFPQAKEQFSKSARKALLELSPELITVGWLEDLQKQNGLYDALLQQGAFTKQEYEKSQLPIRLRKGTAQNFYDTLKEIQRLLLPSEDIRPDDILAYLYPSCHAYYQYVEQQHLKEMAKIPSMFAHGIFTGSPFESYPELLEREVSYDKAGPGRAAEPATEKTSSSATERLLSSTTSENGPATAKIREMLTIYDSLGVDAYEEQRTKLPYEELEDLLQRMDLSRLDKSAEVDLINKLCSSTMSYMHFTLIGSRLFNVGNLRSMIAHSKSLTKLELHHCPSISVEEVVEVVSVARLKANIIVSGAHLNLNADLSSLDEEASLSIEVTKSPGSTPNTRDVIRETARFRQKNAVQFSHMTLIAEALEKIRSGDYMHAKNNIEEAMKIQKRVLQIFKNEISAVLSKEILQNLLSSPCLPFIELLLINKLLDVNQKNSAEGLSPWHMAVRSGNLDLCRLLLARGGAAMNAVTLSEQRTAVHLAVLYGHVHILEWMLDLASPKEAPNINARDNWQHTPLSLVLVTRYAVPQTQHDLVERLLKAKADLTLQYEKEGLSSALHLALHYELYDIAKLIILAGAPLNLVNATKQSVLHVAVLKNAHIGLLLDKGANPNSKDRYGKTPLMLAALNSNVPGLEALLSSSAIDANMRDESQYTALRMSVDSGNLAAIKLLIEKGKADPNVPDMQGVTVMWRAASILYKSEPRTQILLPPPPSVLKLPIHPSTLAYASNVPTIATTSTTDSSTAPNGLSSSNPSSSGTASASSSLAVSTASQASNGTQQPIGALSPRSPDDIASNSTSPLRRTGRGGSLGLASAAQLTTPNTNGASTSARGEGRSAPAGSTPLLALDGVSHSRMASSSVIDVSPRAPLPMVSESVMAGMESLSPRPFGTPGRGKLQPPSLRPKDGESNKSSSKDKKSDESGIVSPRHRSEMSSEKVQSEKSEKSERQRPPRPKASFHSSGKSNQRSQKLNGDKTLMRQTSEAQTQWVACADYLLQRKGDLKNTNERGQPFINWLIQRIVGRGGACGPIEIQFVIDHKIPIDSVDSSGRNFLHIMCDTDWTEAELKAGAGDAASGRDFFVCCARLLLESVSNARRRAMLFQEDQSGLIPLNLSFAYGASLLDMYLEEGGLLKYVSGLSKSDYEVKHPLFQSLKAPTAEPLSKIAQKYPSLLSGSVLQKLKKKSTDVHSKFLETWDSKSD